MRLSHLLAVPAAAILLTSVNPTLAAHADGAGPSVDDVSLYNSGVACASDPAPMFPPTLQGMATDPDSNVTSLSYTFAVWPTADPTQEVDLAAAGVASGQLATLTLSAADVTSGLDYSWRLKASDSNGESAWSATCSFTADDIAPAAPSVTSSNFPDQDRPGPYGVTPAFTLSGAGDPDVFAYEYSWSALPPAPACSPDGPQGRLICPSLLDGNDVVRPAGPGAPATIELMPPGTGTQTLTVAALDRAGNRSAAAAYRVIVPATPPVTITGSAVVGQTLVAHSDGWSPAPDSLEYAWFSGATLRARSASASYVIAAADLGTSISVSVTPIRNGQPDPLSAFSDPTLPVLAAPFVATSTPTITGQTVVGQVLTAQPGLWSPAATFSYLWYRNGHGIGGATAGSYRLTAIDGGTRISVKVTASTPGYLSTSRPSSATGVVEKLLTATPTPRIGGVVRYAQTLAAVAGTWGPAPVALRYQWYVGAAPIRGATGAHYAPSGAYIGQNLSVAVTGVKAGYASVTRHSSQVRLAPAVFTAVPTPRIIGTARVGALLRVSMAATTPGSTLHFQWRSGSASVPGATGASYRVRPTDVDRRLSVVATAVRAGYVSAARGSAGTGTVPGQRYQNCTALKAVYRYGVAKVGVRYNRTPSGNRPLVGPPFFSNSLYSLNAFSDRDKDGIACES